MCQGLAADLWQGLALPLPLLDDPEGTHVPPGLEVVDAHVHLFPPRVYEAIWRWFETRAWPIRYKLYAEETLAFLRERGVKHVVGLHYSHVPGMARALNAFAAELAAGHPELAAFGTVLPGEPDSTLIAREALESLGLRGLKLHCHVQDFAADDPVLDGVYQEAARLNRPIVIHAGREPALTNDKAAIHARCDVGRIRNVLTRHPELTLVVPHLGADEIAPYGALLEEFPGLWLDTTMMLAEYFPQRPTREFLLAHGDRLLYGSDFPNLPYAWDRELKHLVALGLPEATLRAIAGGNAKRLFGWT